jgi:carbonic anhydrase
MSDKELIDKYVSEVQQKRFWGSLQLDFQDGNLALVRKEETIKVRTRMGNNRDDYSHNQPLR